MFVMLVILALKFSQMKLFCEVKTGGCDHYLFTHFFLFFFFNVDHFKVFIELVTVLYHFKFWVFGCEVCGILAPRPGSEPPKLRGEVLITRPPGMS